MSLFSRLKDRLKPAADAIEKYADTDVALQMATAAVIERARVTYPTMPDARWRKGEPLKLLFAGYSGTRNTGADVRVEEMIRQFRHVLGDENLDLTILVHDDSLTRGYFRTAKQVIMPQVFPKFIYEQVGRQHGVIACEGSMFKSKFASALSAFMTGTLGLAAASHKLSIAYGGEAGDMSDSLRELVRRYCKDAFIITRNEQSREVLGELDIKTKLGTDTAWTFEPSPDEVGRQMLMDAGWDGVTPIVAVCPINPFWWPVRPDVSKGIAHQLFGTHKEDHYASIYFHKGGPEVRAKQERYLLALADGIKRFSKDKAIFPICVGMEQLDRKACEFLSTQLDGAPVFVSDTHEMFEMVSVVRQARYMVSSRYHAIVTSMPGGVLSVGVTMDERIRNLMIDRGTPQLALEVDDPHLGAHVAEQLQFVHDNHEAVSESIETCVVRNLQMMGKMGKMLAIYVKDQLPGFPLPANRGRGASDLAHLPPLSPALQALLAKHLTPSPEPVP